MRAFIFGLPNEFAHSSDQFDLVITRARHPTPSSDANRARNARNRHRGFVHGRWPGQTPAMAERAAAERAFIGREVEQAQFAAVLQEVTEAGGPRRSRWSARRPAGAGAGRRRSP